MNAILITGLLPMKPHFHSNKPLLNLVSNQIIFPVYHQIDGILLGSSKLIWYAPVGYEEFTRVIAETAKYFE